MTWRVNGGREGGSRGRRHSLRLIRVVAQQKLSQHCKAIVLQLKINLTKKLQAQKATEAKRSEWNLSKYQQNCLLQPAERSRQNHERKTTAYSCFSGQTGQSKGPTFGLRWPAFSLLGWLWSVFSLPAGVWQLQTPTISGDPLVFCSVVEIMTVSAFITVPNGFTFWIPLILLIMAKGVLFSIRRTPHTSLQEQMGVLTG